LEERLCIITGEENPFRDDDWRKQATKPATINRNLDYCEEKQVLDQADKCGK
jgi:hypothetical protein